MLHSTTKTSNLESRVQEKKLFSIIPGDESKVETKETAVV